MAAQTAENLTDARHRAIQQTFVTHTGAFLAVIAVVAVSRWG